MPTNKSGLCDLHGNVWEWCQDVYVEALLGGRDPVVTTGGSYRVFRGGGWSDDLVNCRTAIRSSFGPSFRYISDLGFRLALSSSVK